jgi:hypothetical protein
MSYEHSEKILSFLRSFATLRMTSDEALRMTSGEMLRMTIVYITYKKSERHIK